MSPGDSLIGRTLGHHEIVSRVAAGGMGEVYRARDLKLGRDVALKILPRELSSHPERLSRFRREAKVLAQLNHPNIVTVFSLEEDDGVHYLTMELVDGATLGEVIPADGLPIDRFFEIAMPLVDAVAAAHASGVVHRDLKPSNVMVEEGGRVKVLDFGLARHDAALGDADTQLSTSLLTEEHRIVGTIGNMSPEQLQGRRVDSRSDIFSLGIVLYQMAVGRRPFEGSSSAELISAIMKENPPRATALRADLPPHLASILSRCLHKQPEERQQSAKDLWLELRELRVEMSTGEAVSSATLVGQPAVRPASRFPLIAAALVAAAVVVGVLIVLPGRREPAQPAEDQVAGPEVTWPSKETEARISPDGQWLSFVSDRDGRAAVWLQRTGGGEAQRLEAGEAAVISQAWSPASDEVALLTSDDGRQRVQVVPAPLGGRPRLSFPVPRGVRLVEWTGTRVFLEAEGGLWTLDLSSGDFSEAPLPGSEMDIRRQFDLADNGTTVTFSAVREGQEDIYLQELGSEKVVPLTFDGAKAIFPHCLGPDCSQIVYLSNRTGQTDVWILDRATGRNRQMRVPTKVERIDDVSSDGDVVALGVIHEAANLWRYDGRSGAHEPLTADSLPDFSPTSTADGRLLAFQRTRPTAEIHSQLLDARILLSELSGGGLGEPRAIAQTGYAPSISPDGRWVAYLETSPGLSRPYFTRLWVADTESGTTALLSERLQLTGFSWYPAGLERRLVAWESGSSLLFVEADESLIPRIRRVEPSAAPPAPETLFTAEEPGQISDLFVSPGTGRVTFLLSSFGDRPWQLRSVLAGGGSEIVLTRRLETGTLRFAGELDSGGMVVVEAFQNIDATQRLEVFIVTEDGSERHIGTLESAWASTLSLAPAGRLYATIQNIDGNNVVAFNIATQTRAMVTANRLPGVVFCGIEPLADDSLVYSRHERNEDLWLLRRGGRATVDQRQE